MDRVFETFFDRAIRCIDGSAAKAVFNLTENSVTTNTEIDCATRDTYFDGPVPGAFSNKAGLQRVVSGGKLLVFKYPLSTTLEHITSVAKEFEFCNLVRSRNEGYFLKV